MWARKIIEQTLFKLTPKGSCASPAQLALKELCEQNEWLSNECKRLMAENKLLLKQTKELERRLDSSRH